jgi:hypothetical protein
LFTIRGGIGVWAWRQIQRGTEFLPISTFQNRWMASEIKRSFRSPFRTSLSTVNRTLL